MIRNIIVQKYNNPRIDIFLAEMLDLNRSKVTKMIKTNRICVNQIIITKPGYEIKLGDVIEISEDLQEITRTLLPYESPLDVKHEDQDLIVVYKPSGILSHPTQFNEQNTMQNIVLFYANGSFTPKLVHRLDKYTSGLIIYAKNDKTQTILKNMFEQRTVVKKYYALVHGVPKFSHININVPIARANDNVLKMVAGEGKNAKSALTEVVTKQTFNKSSLLDITLHTGRTHQIRVHLKYLNLPIINDPLYGMDHEITPYNQYLMAYYLAFKHPISNKPIIISIDLDEEFKEWIRKFK